MGLTRDGTGTEKGPHGTPEGDRTTRLREDTEFVSSGNGSDDRSGRPRSPGTDTWDTDVETRPGPRLVGPEGHRCLDSGSRGPPTSFSSFSSVPTPKPQEHSRVGVLGSWSCGSSGSRVGVKSSVPGRLPRIPRVSGPGGGPGHRSQPPESEEQRAGETKRVENGGKRNGQGWAPGENRTHSAPP